MMNIDKELIDDAEKANLAFKRSSVKGELLTFWREDVDLTPYLAKFAKLQRAREAAKYEARIAELEVKHKTNMETIFRVHDADIKDYELKITELEQKLEGLENAYIPIYQVARPKERGWYWADIKKEAFDDEIRHDHKRILYRKDITNTGDKA